MATLHTDSKGRKYVIVERGDTLSGIAKTYLKDASKYKWLAEINNHPNPNLIHVGDKFYLEKVSSSSSSSSSTTTPSNKVVLTGPNLLATDDKKLFAKWTWSKEKKTKSYKVVWEYVTIDGNKFVGSDDEIAVDEIYPAASLYSTYDIPDNATIIKLRVKPIAKTKKDSKGKETAEFSASWAVAKDYVVSNPLVAPGAPEVEIDDNNVLTATLNNLDLAANEIEFEIVKNDSTSVVIGKNSINKDHGFVSYQYTVEPGHEYKVRCRSVKESLKSDWSPFSSNYPSMPSVPSSITVCRSAGENEDGYAVYLEWGKVNSAVTYDIQYTTKKEYFDNIADTTTVSTEDASTKITIYKLAAGELFFRVRAVNAKASSDWCEPVSVKIGTAPSAPTTWSSTTTAIVTEPLTLYWVHNSEDGSSEEYARLKIIIGTEERTWEIKNDAYYGVGADGFLYKIKDFEDDSEKDLTTSCVIDTALFGDGAEFTWQVCTKGIINQFGDWSSPRTVNVYAQPTVAMTVTDEFEIDENGVITLIIPEGGRMGTLESFPFYVKAVAGPQNQTPVAYHISISTNETYETVDQVGNDKTVTAGEQVYSKYFDISTPLMVQFSADNIDLENGIEYTITCTVSMNSSLTATAQDTFVVNWEDKQYVPNAQIAIDTESYTASISPYCEEYTTEYRKVERASRSYMITEETVDELSIDNVYTTQGDRVYLGKNSYGSEIYYCLSDENGAITAYRVTYSNGVYTTTSSKVNLSATQKVYTSTGEEVSLGVLTDGTAIYYSEIDTAHLVEDITLAVYRREFDGGFTKLADGINNANNTFITDPHPALDYARYRVVAIANSTGAVSYYDLPGHPVGGTAVIIQWAEAWSSFDKWNADSLSQPSWAGSLLKLPYNIDVSDSNTSDVVQVKYIGRKRPVAYYGTQLGETSSWSVEIPKDDKETVYALRRLALWMGDVYVREPSGSGYWATISVSFSQKHCELTIPVTLDITRVEGGI